MPGIVKEVRLKSRTIISQLFSEGKSLQANPVRIVYTGNTPTSPPVQLAFAVPSRNIRQAVSRNKIKRMMREAVATQLPELQAYAIRNHQRIALMFIFTARAIPDFKDLQSKIILLLQRFQKENEPLTE